MLHTLTMLPQHISQNPSKSSISSLIPFPVFVKHIPLIPFVCPSYQNDFRKDKHRYYEDYFHDVMV